MYKTELLHKKRAHKEELGNLREQYGFLLQAQEARLADFVAEFTGLKLGLQRALQQARGELLDLYALVRRQQRLVADAEEGKYS